MEITDIRIFRKDDHDKRLRAFATITFDHCFVVRDIKIIDGQNGLFVAMPSRKIKIQCHECHTGNVIGGKFCSQCGAHLQPHNLKSAEVPDGAEKQLRQSEHKDIAHPITAECRKHLQEVILAAYEKEIANL